MNALVLSLLVTQAAPAPGGPKLASKPAPIVSPELAEDRRVTFRLGAPDARDVAVVGVTKEKVPLARGADGVWSGTVGPLEPGLYEYGFAVDGLQMIDPANPDIKPQRTPRRSILEVPGHPPLATEFQDVPHGTVHIHQYRSKVLGRVRRLHVYTPAEYEKKPRARFPALYLQHGHGDNDAAWTVHGHAHFVADNLIAQGKAQPMVIVMMDGHAIAPDAVIDVERFGDNAEAFRRDLLEEAMPLIEARYRVRPDAASRALIGLSMGGGQALTVGLRHADKFAWVGSFSGATPSQSALAGPLSDAKALGRKLRWLWIGCGKDDFLLARNETFIALLKSRGVEPIWRLTEGNHSWPVWRGYLVEVLPELFAPASSVPKKGVRR